MQYLPHPSWKDKPVKAKIEVVCDVCAKNFSIQISNHKKQYAKWQGKTYCRSCAAKISFEATGRAKKEKTMLEKYGSINPNNVPEIQEKIRQTNLSRYGEGGSTAIARSAFKEKYGFGNPFEIPAILEKAVETSKANHQGMHPNQLVENRNRLRDRMTELVGHSSILLVKLLERNHVESLEALGYKIADFLESRQLPANSDLAKETFQTDGSTLIKALRLINREDLISVWSRTSSKEKEISYYIQGIYNGPVIENDRSVLGRRELDIYLPTLGLAFEFNGLYWHSEYRGVTSEKHYQKYKDCLEKGIALYTLFEHEWNNRKPVILQMIKNLLVSKKKIGARQCSIIKDAERISEFIAENHIQGYVRSQIHLALEYKGEIVLALTVGRHHRKSEQLVLNRVCIKDVHVLGGLDRLLKLCPRPLITWSDNRYSPIGTMYKNAGFRLDEHLRPDYFYTDGTHAYSKQSQKKSIVGCPQEIKEHDFAKNRGLYRVWDCGKRRWILD